MTPLRVVVLIVLVLALLASMAAWGFRLAMQHAPEYRQPLVERLEQELHSTVEVRVLDLGWEGFGPALELHGLKLQGLDAEPVAVQMLRIGFSLWDLVRGIMIPRRVTVEGLDLTLVKSPEGWQLESFPKASDQGNDASLTDAFADLSRVRLRRAKIQFEDALGSLAIGPIHAEEVQLFRRFGRQAVVGDLRDEHGGRLHIELALQRGQPVDVKVLAEGWQPSHFQALDSRLANLSQTRLAYLQGRATRGEAHSQRWQLAGDIRVEQHAATVSGAEQLVLEGPVQGTFAPTGVQLDSPQLRVSSGDARWPSQNFWLEYRTGDKPKVRAQLGWVDLEDLWPHIRPWVPTDTALVSLAGVLSDVTLDWEAGQQTPAFLAQATGLGFQLSEPAVLLSGVDGEFSSSANRGRAMLNSRDIYVQWPAVLEEPVLVNSVAGTLDWALQEQGFQFELPDLAYSLAGIDGVGRVTGEANGAWHTELRFMTPDAGPAQALMPAFWHERLKNWLSDAIRSGELRDGYVRLDGFKNKVRHSEVDLDLADVELHFAPGWQDVAAANAKLEIRDRDLRVQAPLAQIGGVVAKAVSVSKRLQPGEPLLVDAEIDSRAEHIFELLESSPVARKIESLSQAVDFSGACSGRLSLSVPLKRGLRPRWSADAALDDVRIDIAQWPSPVEKLRGQIQVSAEGIAGESLSGEMNGWPLQLRASRSSGNSHIHAAARVELDQLPQSWPLPPWLTGRLSGQADVTVETEIQARGDTQITVRSDLVGSAIALPPPLAKPVSMARLFELRFVPKGSELRLVYGSQLAINSRNLGRAGQSMALRLGAAQVSPSPAEGIWVDGQLPVVQLEPWIDLVSEMAGKSARGARVGTVAQKFGGLNLSLGEARFAGQSWADVDLQVLRSGESWLLSTRSDSVQGQMLLNQQDDKKLAIAGQFEELHWRLGSGDSKAGTTKSAGIELPKYLPSLDIRASRFVVNDEELGPMSLAISATGSGYIIDELRIGSDLKPSLEVSGTVNRELSASSSEQNHLEFQLQTNDGRPWLRALAYDKQLDAGTVNASGVLRWREPEDLRNLKVNGDVQFRFENGRLLSVEPGAGRLLGLLSMTSLPRRFLLDFSDVTDTGLGYDSLTGSYLIEQGVAQTSNLKITTPSVRVEATGEVNLPERSQDQLVKILPGISHGFTAAATVLGGPAVGLFLLFAQELLDKPLDQVGQLAYRIRGPLENPEVEAVK